MKTLALALVIALTGCASTPDNPAMSAEAAEPLLCSNKPQCDAYWQRAQVWVASNSNYRIQVATDAIIETYGPYTGKAQLAFRVTRVPNADGSARILILPACDGLLGCYPTRTAAVIDFKRFVRQA